MTIPKHFSLYLNTLNATHPLFSQLYLIIIETTSCRLTKYLHPILTRPTHVNKSHMIQSHPTSMPCFSACT